MRQGSRQKPAQIVAAFSVSPGTKVGEAGSAGTGLPGALWAGVCRERGSMGC